MKNYRIEAVILAVGTAVLGLFVYFGLSAFAAKDRVVSVRGLAEREVKADHVIWPIVYKTTGNDLSALYEEVNGKCTRITAFLEQNGLAKADISVGAPQVVDLYADRYASDNVAQRDRYNITTTITVSSGQVDKVRGLMTRMGELLKQGIAISAGDYDSRVQYDFTSLNKIKPQMIEEATQKAREAAVKFADDSDSRLGKIKDATQGLFSIEDRDQYTPYIKNVRVVTSVNYFLES
jgi:uncharacterized protein